MGIFQDFIDSRPMRIESERIARRELEALRDQGDTEAPGGFVGRTGWAILKVLTLTNFGAPPTQGELIGYSPQDIDYQRALISPDTAKVIANQIASDDGNRALEDELLIHLDLCISKPGDTTTCAPKFSIPLNWTPCSLIVDDYTHRWSADAQTSLVDGDDVFLVNDTGSAGINLTAPGGHEIKFVENGMAALPVFRFTRPNDGRLASVSDVSWFPAKRGTAIYVWQINEDIVTNPFALLTEVGARHGIRFQRSDQVETPIRYSPAAGGLVTPEDRGTISEIPVDTPQIITVQRVADDRMVFRRNGILQTTHPGLTIGDGVPVVDEVEFGFLGGGGGVTAINHDLAMVLHYDRVLTEDELISVESQLAACYGVTIPANTQPVITYTGGGFVLFAAGTVTFSGPDLMTFSDVDIPLGNKDVVLDVLVNQPSGGEFIIDFSLFQTTGLSILNGSATDETVFLRARGSLTDINAAMAGAIVEVRNEVSGGSGSLFISIHDRAEIGTGKNAANLFPDGSLSASTPVSVGLIL